jgi:hypothetical protein
MGGGVEISTRLTALIFSLSTLTHLRRAGIEVAAQRIWIGLRSLSPSSSQAAGCEEGVTNASLNSMRMPESSSMMLLKLKLAPFDLQISSALLNRKM